MSKFCGFDGRGTHLARKAVEMMLLVVLHADAQLVVARDA